MTWPESSWQHSEVDASPRVPNNGNLENSGGKNENLHYEPCLRNFIIGRQLPSQLPGVYRQRQIARHLNHTVPEDGSWYSWGCRWWFWLVLQTSGFNEIIKNMWRTQTWPYLTIFQSLPQACQWMMQERPCKGPRLTPYEPAHVTEARSRGVPSNEPPDLENLLVGDFASGKSSASKVSWLMLSSLMVG